MDARTDDASAAAEFPERPADTESAIRANLSRRTANPESGSLLLRSAAGDGEHNDLAEPKSHDRIGPSAIDCRFPAACTGMSQKIPVIRTCRVRQRRF